MSYFVNFLDNQHLDTKYAHYLLQMSLHAGFFDELLCCYSIITLVPISVGYS